MRKKTDNSLELLDDKKFWRALLDTRPKEVSEELWEQYLKRKIMLNELALALILSDGKKET